MNINPTTKEIKQQLIDAFLHTYDFVNQELNSSTLAAHIFYLTDLCDPDTIKKQLIRPFYEIDNAPHYQSYLISFPACKSFVSIDDTINKLWEGYAVLCLDNEFLLFNAKKFEQSISPEAQIEPTILGSNDTLTGDISSNMRMLRQRCLMEFFQSENIQIDLSKKINVTLVYHEKLTSPNVLKQLKSRLQQLNDQTFKQPNQMQRILTQQKWAIFPTVLMTSRPDRIIKNIQEGKVAILVEGIALAYIVPSFFTDFFTSMDDLYHLRIVEKSLLTIRFIALILSLFLPAAYIVVTAYIPEFFRVELALSIAGSRIMIPYPTFVEMFFLLFIMELLTESSVRLPKSVGPAGTTVGGLILGQASIEAGIVSSMVVIIVSAVAISNFVIPVQNMSYSVRVIKYFFLLLALIFGLLGLIIGMVGVVFYIIQLPNYGDPFLQLFKGKRYTNKGSDLP